MVESDAEREQMLECLLGMITREFGRRNVTVKDNSIRIRDHAFNINVNVYVYRDTALAYAYMHGEGEFNKFPLDGSMYTLEQLIENTSYGPGAYVNSGKTFYVPNYPFLIKRADLDNGEFVVRVINRLVEMADFNSFLFNMAMEDQEEDSDLEDLDFEEDEMAGISTDDAES